MKNDRGNLKKDVKKTGTPIGTSGDVPQESGADDRILTLVTCDLWRWQVVTTYVSKGVSHLKESRAFAVKINSVETKLEDVGMDPRSFGIKRSLNSQFQKKSTCNYAK